jgi:hypothetical protein
MVIKMAKCTMMMAMNARQQWQWMAWQWAAWQWAAWQWTVQKLGNGQLDGVIFQKE